MAALLPALGAALLLAPASAQAATITVNTATDTSGAQCTLRDAIKAANTNAAQNGCVGGQASPTVDTIQFQLPNPSTITLGSALDQISADLNIQGPGESQLIVSGHSLYRVFNIASGKTVSISGLTVTGGSVTVVGCDAATADAGSGILNRGTLTLNRVVVSGNQATATEAGGGACAIGAGISNLGGTLTLNQSTVSGNRASATATGASNEAIAQGAGIYSGPNLTINQSTVSGNTTHAYVTAGAIANAPGAGILNLLGPATLTNTTVTNNGEITPGGLGGGIFSNGTLALRNDTISQNVASAYAGDGGNLYNAGSAASVTAKNTIIAEALTSGNCGGTLPTSLGNDLGFESTGDTYPCFTPGNGNVFADPMLGPLQDNGGPTQTEAIRPGSAALDAGSGCEATDQRGLLRGGPAGPCDIGAFELNASPPDTTPPNTSITKLSVNSAKHKATLRFKGTDPAPSSLPLHFKCKIDKKPYRACRSPKTYRHLKVGKHKFRVKASDAAGNLDLTPAVKRFRIKP